ncbi:MAG: hypothetical protein B6D46_07215 [Polyangiaceae bacterium UTPRO1]|jgi:signal transduction histidine kinase|nr:ATP-binding protein [Myxococcales bacterium]OQY67815.1 MAG: hypothetical protein B6D46_07215 [Polyangiaceae bacterium UTPRO1]
MSSLVLLSVIAGTGVLAQLVRRAGRASVDSAWLAPTLRALADDPGAAAEMLTERVATGIGASHVEWWRRGDDGVWESRLGRIVDDDARALDAWAAAAAVWQRSGAGGEKGTEAAVAALARTGAQLVVPVRSGRCPLGLLAVGGRCDGRAYAAREVDDVEVLAHHLALLGEREETAARLAETRRMLQQATSLSAVGTLAAELAHEIRNPLTAVQTFLQLLPERLDDPEVAVDLRTVASSELQRVARLLDELLGMARTSIASFATTDLELVVDQVVRLLRVSAGKKDVTLERRGDALPLGVADAPRLKQALMNLVLNAIQASPAGTTVRVETRALREGAGGPGIEVVVGDDGPGVAPDERERIFEPFVTTKANGTGLGLPVTRQIVADHGGTIAVETGPAGGATFRVRLPLVLPSAERRDRAA